MFLEFLCDINNQMVVEITRTIKKYCKNSQKDLVYSQEQSALMNDYQKGGLKGNLQKKRKCEDWEIFDLW